jgi:hypothetical protein
MTNKTGGPAFPASIPTMHNDDQGKDYPCYEEAGMSLRTWLAGQALVALQGHKAIESQGIAWLVTHAYMVADAMLAEQEK